jgi:hypothetical protein
MSGESNFVCKIGFETLTKDLEKILRKEIGKSIELYSTNIYATTEDFEVIPTTEKPKLVVQIIIVPTDDYLEKITQEVSEKLKSKQL